MVTPPSQTPTGAQHHAALEKLMGAVCHKLLGATTNSRWLLTLSYPNIAPSRFWERAHAAATQLWQVGVDQPPPPAKRHLQHTAAHQPAWHPAADVLDELNDHDALFIVEKDAYERCEALARFVCHRPGCASSSS